MTSIRWSWILFLSLPQKIPTRNSRLCWQLKIMLLFNSIPYLEPDKSNLSAMGCIAQKWNTVTHGDDLEMYCQNSEARPATSWRTTWCAMTHPVAIPSELASNTGLNENGGYPISWVIHWLNHHCGWLKMDKESDWHVQFLMPFWCFVFSAADETVASGSLTPPIKVNTHPDPIKTHFGYLEPDDIPSKSSLSMGWREKLQDTSMIFMGKSMVSA